MARPCATFTLDATGRVVPVGQAVRKVEEVPRAPVRFTTTAVADAGTTADRSTVVVAPGPSRVARTRSAWRAENSDPLPVV